MAQEYPFDSNINLIDVLTLNHLQNYFVAIYVEIFHLLTRRARKSPQWGQSLQKKSLTEVLCPFLVSKKTVL